MNLDQTRAARARSAPLQELSLPGARLIHMINRQGFCMPNHQRPTSTGFDFRL